MRLEVDRLRGEISPASPALDEEVGVIKDLYPRGSVPCKDASSALTGEGIRGLGMVLPSNPR